MEEKTQQLLAKFGDATLEVKARIEAISYFGTKLRSMGTDIVVEEQIKFLQDYWKLNDIESMKSNNYAPYMQEFLEKISSELVMSDDKLFEQGKSSEENLAQVILYDAPILILELKKQEEFKKKAIGEFYNYLNKYIEFVSLYILEHDCYELTHQDKTTFKTYAELLQDTKEIADKCTLGQSIGVLEQLMNEMLPRLKEVKDLVNETFIDQITNHYLTLFLMYVSGMVARGPVAQMYVEGLNDNSTKGRILNFMKQYEEEIGFKNESTKELFDMAKVRLEKSLEQTVSESSSGCLGLFTIIFVSSLTTLGIIGSYLI